MGKRFRFIILFLVLVALALPLPAGVQAAEPAVVRAIFFFSPTCGHCHQVITEAMLPLMGQYGDQLQIVAFDTSQPAGGELYQATIDRWEIPRERRGVPMLVVRDQVLVGSVEIPAQFPALVESGLAAGDTGWPEIPGLVPLLDQADNQVLSAAPGASPVEPIADEEPPPDPVGFALASLVLAGLVAALGYAVWRLSRPAAWGRILRLSPAARPKGWAIPCLCLVGLAVASYLAYVEVNQVEAICGPVGKCNLVQTSEYALFLGVPVAVWGVLNYLGVAGLWVGGRTLAGRWGDLSLMGIMGLTLFGVLFSIYLTCLELFAIHAICSWCLGSAVITAALMMLVVTPVTDPKAAFARPKKRRRRVA